MRLFIIRHGETALNVEGRLQGNLDIPLNENGIALAKLTGEALKEENFDLLLTSPLSRARLTGELVAAPSASLHGRTIEVIEDDRLREIRFGKWEGLCPRKDGFNLPGTTYHEFHRLFVDSFHYVPCAGGETIQQVISRTDEFLQEVIANPDWQDLNILIATHGCALRGMLNRYYEDKMNFWQSQVPYNCSVNIVEAENGRQELVQRDRIYYDCTFASDKYI